MSNKKSIDEEIVADVCLCGCPVADHDRYEEGLSCAHDDHECLPVWPSVLSNVNDLRAALAKAEERNGLREEQFQGTILRLARTETKLAIATEAASHNGALVLSLQEKIAKTVKALETARSELRNWTTFQLGDTNGAAVEAIEEIDAALAAIREVSGS